MMNRNLNFGKCGNHPGACHCKCNPHTSDMPMIPKNCCPDKCDPDSSLNNDPLLGMPLGIGYVPWQQWDCVYNFDEGLEKGTIFPSLDLPFCGCIPRGYRIGKGGSL